MNDEKVWEMDHMLDLMKNSSPVSCKSNGSSLHYSDVTEVDKNKEPNPVFDHLEPLEEIHPEVTEEGYGLRTPYGTHLNLDFVKYCENLMSVKRHPTRPPARRSATSTSSDMNGRLGASPATSTRLSSGRSNDSLDSMTSSSDGSKMSNENILNETRKRLEAFWPYRKKKSSPHDSVADNRLAYSSPFDVKQGNNGVYSRREHLNSTCSSGTRTPNSVASCNHHVSPHHLQVVREQMAAALARIKDLEEQVKTISVLEQTITHLKKENQCLKNEKKKFEQNQPVPVEPPMFPRHFMLSSSSSGVSSCSPESTLISPHHHGSPMPKPSDIPPTLPPKVKSPRPPHRKYRSLGCGEDESVWDVVCYSKKESVDAEITCDLLEESKPEETPSRPQLVDKCVGEGTSMGRMNYGCQTRVDEQVATTQTCPIPATTIGVGDCHFYTLRDNSCGTDATATRNVHTMTMTSQQMTPSVNRATSTHDLKRVTMERGCDPIAITEPRPSRKSVGVGTPMPPIRCSQGTGSDDLVTYRDISTGSDSIETRTRAVNTETSLTASSRAAICLKPSCHVATLTDFRRPQVRSVSSGWDKPATRSRSAGTDTVLLHNSYTQTARIQQLRQRSLDVGVNARVDSKDGSTCTYAPKIVDACVGPSRFVVERGTDVQRFELPSKNTQTMTTMTEKTTRTKDDHESSTSSSSTATAELRNDKKWLRDYVDQVECLIEEQEQLLSTSFSEDSKRELAASSKKVKHVENIEDVDEVDDVDISYTNSPNHEHETDDLLSVVEFNQSTSTDSTTPEQQSSSMEVVAENQNTDASGPSSANAETKKEMKSIMKKPGDSKQEKKSLKFAEDVIEYDSSSDEDDDDFELKSDSKNVFDFTNALTKRPANLRSSQRPLTLPVENRAAPETTSKESKLHGTSTISGGTEVKEEVFDYMNDDAKIFKQATVESDDDTATTASEESDYDDDTEKYHFYSGLVEACKVLQSEIDNPEGVDQDELALAETLMQREWFEVAAQADSYPQRLQVFLVKLREVSKKTLFKKIVNMTDISGNNVLHYALSHGKTEIANVLLTIEELNVNNGNRSGYTPAMLAALCEIRSEEEESVFRRLFSLSDVNIHAKEAQTALMLATSHKRLQTTKLLLESGADVNARDQDGSTALMCAAENGYSEIVKLLLQNPQCKPGLTDEDGSTALSIAIKEGHTETALELYASVHFNKLKSPTVQKQQQPQRKSSQSMLPRPVRHVKM